MRILESASNLISRGLPTRASHFVVNEFRRHFPWLPFDWDSPPSIPEKILRHLPGAILPFDPRISAQQAFGHLRTSGNSALLKTLLPVLQATLGPAAIQFMEVQEPALLLRFSVPSGNQQGIRFIAEAAAKQDQHVEDSSWITVPVGADAAALKAHVLALVREHSAALQPIRNASQSSPFSSTEALDALQLTLTPVAVARLQKTLVECMLAGVLDMSAPEWNIAVIERDVPCAWLAVQDLSQLLDRLLLLEGAGRKLPPIKLAVYATTEFAKAALRAADVSPAIILSSKTPMSSCDLLLDISVLRLDGIPDEDVMLPDVPVVRIRSARSDRGERRFFSSTGMVYKGVSQRNQGAYTVTTEAEAALRAMLLDVFGFSDFLPGQLDMLGRLLHGENLLAALPPAAGKTLPVLLAAVMQSAVTLITAPSSDLLSGHARVLERAGIDACILLHEAQRREARLEALRRLSAGTALIAFLPANLLGEEDVRKALEETRKNGHAIIRAVIDEAHCASEWSHDPRFTMQHLPVRICTAVSAAPFKYIPLALLTASMSPRVHAHLLRQISNAHRLPRVDSAWLCFLPGVLPAPCRLLPVLSKAQTASARTDEIRALLQAVPGQLKRTQESLSSGMRLADAELSQLFGSGSPHAAVIFTPEASGPDGVSMRYGHGGSEALAEQLDHEPFRTGRYTGQDTEAMVVGRQILRDAAVEYGKFAYGESNLLVTTRAWGIGSDRRGIRATIHTSPPASVARLLQECARAGHDGKAAVCSVIIPEQMLRRKRGTEYEQLKEQVRRGFSSAAREKQILSDLLREITYPEDMNTSRIANLLSDEFGVPLIASYWQRGLDERLYLQTGKGVSLGYIDLVTLTIVVDQAAPDQPFAKEVLDFAFAQSLAAAGSGPSLSAWVSATFPSDVEDGIARQMKDFDPGGTFTLRVGYDNDREPLLTQIHSLLWRRADIQVQRKILSEISADTWESFCEQVEQRSQKPGLFDTLEQDLGLALRQIFLKIRGRADTERAILRLMALGAVTDCISYPASRKFGLTMNVRRDAEYREALEDYVRMLMPEKDAQRVLQVLPTYTGESMLEQCLNFFIDHLYRWAGDSHDREIADLEILLHSASKDDAPERFQSTAVHTVLARYARPDDLPDALSHDGSSQLQYLLLIAEGLESDGPSAVFEHIRHLRRSCDMLQPQYPDSLLLEALAALTDVIDRRDDTESRVSRDRFSEALLLCLAASDADRASCEASIHRLGMILRRHVSDELLSAVERKVIERLAGLSEIRAELAASRKAAEVKKATPKPAAEAPAKPVVQPPVAVSPASPPPPVAVSPAPRSDEGRSAGTAALPTAPSKTKTGERAPAPAPDVASASGTAASDARKSASADGLDLDTFERMLRGTLGDASPAARAVTPIEVPEDAESPPDLRVSKKVDPKAAKPSQQAQQQSVPPAPKQPVAPVPGRTPQPSGKAASAEVTPPAPPPPDPVLLTHLSWLTEFNNRFLKDYESRNA